MLLCLHASHLILKGELEISNEKVLDPVCSDLPISEGITHLGCFSPANPALIVPDPMSRTAILFQSIGLTKLQFWIMKFMNRLIFNNYISSCTVEVVVSFEETSLEILTLSILSFKKDDF